MEEDPRSRGHLTRADGLLCSMTDMSEQFTGNGWATEVKTNV
jgi:hypothetical protein